MGSCISRGAVHEEGKGSKKKRREEKERKEGE